MDRDQRSYWVKIVKLKSKFYIGSVKKLQLLSLDNTEIIVSVIRPLKLAYSPLNVMSENFMKVLR